jgi:hypothetical protein
MTDLGGDVAFATPEIEDLFCGIFDSHNAGNLECPKSFLCLISVASYDEAFVDTDRPIRIIQIWGWT